MLKMLSACRPLLTAPLRHTACCTRHHSTQHYDVVIVGGGLVGNAAAVALGLEDGLENKRVLVLDQSPNLPTFEKNSPFNLRVINLTVGNADFFSKLGVWDRVKDMRFHSYNNIFCWESNSNQTISFSENPMGFIVENNVLELALLQAAENLQNVEMRKGVQVKDIKLPLEPKSTPVTLTLDSGSVLETDLLIGADGSNSFVRRMLDVPTLSWSYNQQGIVCTLQSDNIDMDMNAYQRFLNTGPIALLPLGNGLFSLVWSCKDSLAEELMGLPDEEFVGRVNNALQKAANISGVVAAIEHMSQQCGMLEEPPKTPVMVDIQGPRGKFPLAFSQAVRYVGPRTALLGDAAHRVHPLAGQGANLGFRGVQRLCHEIENNPDKNLGDYRVLNSFETKFQRYITPMLCFLDGMNKVYSTSFEPVVVGRSVGLGFVNNTEILKELFVENARS